MTKPVISSFRWENTLFCFLVQHVKKKKQHTPFLHREKLVLEQSETSSCVKSCCSCLFTCALELHPAVLGMLSVAKIKINGFSVTAELAEHIARAAGDPPERVGLFPPVNGPQGSPHRLASSPLCSGVNNKLDGCFFPSPVNASSHR